MSEYSPVAVSPKDEKYANWRVENALRTLQDAHEHLRDAKMMKLVRKMAKEKKADLEKIEEMGKGVKGEDEKERGEMEELM